MPVFPPEEGRQWMYQTQGAAIRGGLKKAAPIAADFTPVVGDAKGILDAILNPSLINVGLGLAGLIPGVPSLTKLYKKKNVNAVFDFDAIGGYKTINVGKTIENLPDVPEGHTRLFRAEGGKYTHNDVWDASGLEKSNPDHLPGQFFTTDLEYADYYRETYGRGAKIVYVDVPTKNLPELQSPKYHNEFIVETLGEGP